MSIDGGGSRGVIPVNVLNYIETEEQLSIRGEFDFFAGVSTGALVAAYLARDVGSIENLATYGYSSESMSKIFDKSIWDKMLGRMQNQPKYDGINKRAFIDGQADGACINDIVDKHLLILAYDFINRELVTFKNNRGHDAVYNPSLAEVCDAATAAPTMYPPVATSSPKRRWLIDGALATNDPSQCAISEALAIGHKIEDIWMLSLGTGKPAHDLSQEDRDKIGEDSRGWGIIDWLTNGLLDHMMSASSSVSAHQCEQLLGERYLRINGELPRSLMQLDNTTETRVEDLKSYAFLWFEQFVGDIRTLLDGAREARARAGQTTTT
ncbi:MAG: patatin-like phospholipase family protein [Gammaproteobacteria bacterium]|nr:patatin-like phospholipase family protein [Gammaproteobacteria bacterium]